MVSPYSVDEAGHKQTWSLPSDIKLRVRKVSLHVDSQEPSAYHSHPQIVIVVGSLYVFLDMTLMFYLDILRKYIVVSESTQVLFHIWRPRLIQAYERIDPGTLFLAR